MSIRIPHAALSMLEKVCIEQTRRVESTLRKMNALSAGGALEDFLKRNKLASPDETVFQVFNRSAKFLAEAGQSYYAPSELESLQTTFLSHAAHFKVILGSPILANAGRREMKSISACSIPPVHLSKMSRSEIMRVVSSYHTRGMGTGFSLDDLEDPIEMVKYLNEIAIKEVQEGKIERSVGNMGVLSVEHPKVMDYIRIRIENPQIQEWKFNLSVNITDSFLKALCEKKPFCLKNGTFVNPELLMFQIAENAHATGDPGIIFMDRINGLNRVPQLGSYKTVVPCGEVSLHAGEVCQFAYLNMIRFVKEGRVDFPALREAIVDSIEMLDNAVEANISRMPNDESAERISSLRRVGLGLCGFAETLQALGLAYDSEEGRVFGKNLMGFISFHSKVASVELARKRGPFPLFTHPKTRRELFIEPFSKVHSDFVSEKEWNALRQSFRLHHIRNLATTILPPTGRSSMMAGVTGSIEPPFRLVSDTLLQESLEVLTRKIGYKGSLRPILSEIDETGSVQKTDLPVSLKAIFKTALEVAPEDHVKMVAAFQSFTDEGISKTVNLPERASIEDVARIFQEAHSSGLKGMTVYRDNCRSLQPKKLNKSKDSHMISDMIYGSMPISLRLEKLLNSPLLQRLKKVHQNGVSYLFDPRQSTSRYEHSVGVMMLTQLLGGSESTQVSALLHDVSHTAFSHVVDQVFKLRNQDFHNQRFSKFMSSIEAKSALEACKVTEDELDYRKVPMVAGEGLTADRLDYVIRDLVAVNSVFQPEYSSILNGIEVGEEGEIICKTLGTARLVFRKFLQVNEEVYFNPLAEVSSLVMASLLRKMLEAGLLTEEDLFTTDDEVILKIQNSPFKSVFEKIGPELEYKLGTSKDPCVTRKLRYVDPKIKGIGSLTAVCEESRGLLKKYLSLPTTVHYEVPLLKTLEEVACVER